MKKRVQYSPHYNSLSKKEQLWLSHVTTDIRKYVEATPELNEKGIKTRDVHATTYSILKGKFIPHRSDEIKSFFPEHHLDVVMRISNAHLKLVKGFQLPAFGCAFKIEHQSKTLANYPLVNFPLFPFVNVTRFLKIFKSINLLFTPSTPHKWKVALKLMGQLGTALPELLHPSLIKNGIKFFLQRKKYILNFEYHSIGVYRWGDEMIKLKMVPIQKPELNSKEKKPSIPAYLDQFGSYQAHLQIQFCQDEKENPINQLNKEWKNAPFLTVGKIILDQVITDTTTHDNLSFNPFENIESLKPVGKIQQLREQAYKVSFEERTKP